MLVDLGRNDLGRVCRFGTVTVPEFMKVEHYSHVAHLVSSVIGELADGKDALDALVATFPAGHALGSAEDPGHGDHRRARAGAPRPLRRRPRLPRPRRQPRLLHRHPHPRHEGGPGDAPGGGGIVADSDPAYEERETEAKAGAHDRGPAPGGRAPVILLVDNYDSFTFNLYQYLGELGAEVRVIRNDEMSVDDALALKPEKIVISPGPGTPDEAGISLELIRRSPVPLLGRLPRPPGPRARSSAARSSARQAHARQDLGDPPRRQDRSSPACPTRSPPRATTRWWWRPRPVPDCLEVSAWTDGGVVMGLRHRERPARGRAVPSREHPHRARARTCSATSSGRPRMARGSTSSATSPR